jgi:hypothetical protein
VPRATLLVMANSEPGHEEEFNRWYDQTHIPDVLKIPGFISARRFSLSGHQLPGFAAPGFQYLTIWDLEADDLALPLAAMAAAVGTPEMPISKAMVVTGDGAVRTVVVEPVGQDER